MPLPAGLLSTGRSVSGGGSRARDRAAESATESWRVTCRLDRIKANVRARYGVGLITFAGSNSRFRLLGFGFTENVYRMKVFPGTVCNFTIPYFPSAVFI